MRYDHRHEIPEEWTGDFALSFVGFLEGIIGAVWEKHGPEMMKLLDRQVRSYSTGPSEAEEFLDQLDTDISF